MGHSRNRCCRFQRLPPRAADLGTRALAILLGHRAFHQEDQQRVAVLLNRADLTATLPLSQRTEHRLRHALYRTAPGLRFQDVSRLCLGIPERLTVCVAVRPLFVHPVAVCPPRNTSRIRRPTNSSEPSICRKERSLFWMGNVGKLGRRASLRLLRLRLGCLPLRHSLHPSPTSKQPPAAGRNYRWWLGRPAHRTEVTARL